MNGVGNAYRLDFFAEGTVDGQPRWMDAVDAHRIETGFYAGINRSVSAMDFADAAQIDIKPLQITELAKAGAAFGNLYNSYDSARDGEATARLVATLMYGAAFGERQELQELVSAIGQSLYRSGRITKAKHDLLVRSLPDMLNDLSKSQASVSVQMRSLVLASVLDSLEQGATVSPKTIDAITQANALYQDTTRYPSNPLLQAVREKALEKFDAMSGKSDEKMRTSLAVTRKLVADTISDPSLYIAVRTVIQEHLDELVSLLFTDDEPIKKFVTKAAYYLVVAPGTDTILGLSQIVGYLGDILRSIGKGEGLSTSTLQNYVGDAIAALTDLAKSIANTDADFTAEYADVTNNFGEFSNWNQEKAVVSGFLDKLRSLADSALVLLTGSTNAYGEEVTRAIREAKDIVTSAAQTLVLRPNAGPNPFNDANFDPEAAPVATGAIKEGQVKTFTLYLPYAVGEDGQRIRLQLNGSAADRFLVLDHGDALEIGSDGFFELTVPVGRREIAFSLWAEEDVDTNETLGLSAQLVDIEGNPTHLAHLELNLALDATEENDQYTRTLQGDREWQVFYAAAELEDGASPLPTGGPLVPGEEWTVTLNQPVNPQDPTWANWRIDQAESVLVGSYEYLGWTVKEYRLTSATWAYNRTDELGNLITTDTAVAQGDRLYGSAGNDRILAGAGDDEVEAKAGADRVELGEGDDHAQGGDGADTLVGGTGMDILFGQAGDDLLYANAEIAPAAALLQGQSQSPQDGESGWLDSGDGDDRLTGDAGADILLGGAGNDLILGGGGDDHLAGDDSGHEVPQYLRWLAYQVAHDVTTDAAGNRLYSYRYSTVNDVARQAGGDDALYGGAGNDWLFGQGGDDYLDGGTGNDVAFGDEGDDVIVGGRTDKRSFGGGLMEGGSQPLQDGEMKWFSGGTYQEANNNSWREAA